MAADASQQVENTIQLPPEALMFANNLMTDIRTVRIQGYIVLAGAACGAVAGVLIVDDGHGLAALAGGTVGLILGTLISGAVLACMKTPERQPQCVTIDDVRRRIRRLKRLSRVLTPVGLMCFVAVWTAAYLVMIRGLPWRSRRFTFCYSSVHAR